ncbi:RHS repeat-associated protein [Pseudomonas lini]|uniref:RHS repeat-associated core domain-containing protein n=1 Tax=Pseudomonas lini TaxID=163011 RepID=UPI00278941DB|nr:RHS repeat-associated core domain-containing protein [Pseudomonas lini]MDQ0122331.1 RHS repeat-associated protein [Pseudomonas lini]
MPASSMKILCRYLYDPLDRLMGVGLLERASTERFYQGDYLTTELGEQTQRTMIRHEARPLAQQQSTASVTDTMLLVTDHGHTLLQTLGQTNPQQLAYTAYGHHQAESGLSRLIGFNGERPDAITGHYLLGQGKRAFNPVLMRFNSPDELSPFGNGGINQYAYCGGDPINFFDTTGNIKELIKALANTHITPAQKALTAIKPTTASITSQTSQAIASTSQKIPTVNMITPDLAQLNFPLPKTPLPANRAILAPGELDLIDAGLKYDQLKSTPGFKTVASMENIGLLLRNRKQAARAKTANDKRLISEKSKGVILHIKNESVTYHESQSVNKLVRQ